MKQEHTDGQLRKIRKTTHEQNEKFNKETIKKIENLQLKNTVVVLYRNTMRMKEHNN